MEFTNLKAFNGTLTDSTYTTSQTLSDIYKTLLMCRVRNVTAGFVTPEEYATRWYTQRTKGIITLSGQYFKYNRFADNTYPSKINYASNKFSDKYVNGTWQNPYEEKQLFAMAPSVAKHKGLSFDVKLPSNLFFTNYPATVQNIQIDFSDGLGYRTVAYNQLVSVSYAQPNIYTWKYKVNLTNGQNLLSHSKVQIEEGLNALPLNQQAQRNGTGGICKTTITATESYLGHFGSATVYIRFAGTNTTITNPLIVAEGLDTGIILNPEQEGGDNNIEDFLFNINNSGSNLPIETDTYDIIYVDWNNGVDFIQRNAFVLEEVIRWVNNNKTTTVPNVVLGQSMGGLVARYALRDIELNRNFVHDTRLYVSHDAPHLGANTPYSVQYSARHLRNVYINTPVALATAEVVIPLIYNFAEGFSAIINFYGGNTSVPPFITPLNAFAIADVPAARQMQYTWLSHSYIIDNTIHNAWQTEYSQLGYPQGTTALPIRNVAIANGSECGVIQPDNGNILSYIKDAGKDTVLTAFIGLLDAVFGVALLRPEITLVALIPGKSYWEIDFQAKYMTVLNQNKNVYHGSIKYKKKVFYFIPVSMTVTNKDKVQPTGTLPYDIYGGGLFAADTGQLPIANIVSNPFGFIPTASALDIGRSMVTLNDTDYRRAYVGSMPPSAPKNTLFQNYVTHFDRNNLNNNNSPHISFNTHNGNWLQAELNVLMPPQITDCSIYCVNAQINGSQYLCGPQPYSFSTPATSFGWSIPSGGALVTLSGGATNTITLTPVSTNVSGTVILSLSLNSENCGSTVITKTIWVGRPHVTSNVINGGYDNVGINTTSQLSVNAAQGNTGFYWFITVQNSNCPSGGSLPKFQIGSGLETTLTTSSPYAYINWGDCTGQYIVNCRAINICGTADVSYKIVNVYDPNSSDPCDEFGLKIYANPSKGEDVTILAYRPAPGPPCDDPERLAEKTENTSYHVEIFNFQGLKVYSGDFENGTMHLKNLGFATGVYAVHIIASDGIQKKELLIVK